LKDKQIVGVFKRFVKNKQVAFELIESSFLSDKYKERYKEILEKKIFDYF
jgi:serine/threonine-protein kinase HipA